MITKQELRAILSEIRLHRDTINNAALEIRLLCNRLDAALNLLPDPPQSATRFISENPDVLWDQSWDTFRVVITNADYHPWINGERLMRQIGGCIGYAFKEVLAGEPLSDPEMISDVGSGRERVAIAHFYYDPTKSQRDDPDYLEAFQKAERYIKEGTPIRKTDRLGPGTKGTRLVEGIGECDVKFYIIQEV